MCCVRPPTYSPQLISMYVRMCTVVNQVLVDDAGSRVRAFTVLPPLFLMPAYGFACNEKNLLLTCLMMCMINIPIVMVDFLQG